MASKVGKQPLVNRILMYLLILVLVVYAAVQVVGLFSKDVEVARLREYTTEEKISLEGMFFRNERVIQSDYAGGCDYAVSDGEKVALSDRIAVIYEDSGDTAFLEEVRGLELQLESLKDIYEAGSLFDYDITRLDEQINQTIYSILDDSDSGSAESAQPKLRELERLMNKRAIINGSAQVTQEQIDALEQELNAMTSGSGRVLQSVVAPVSGYFTSGYDGAEGVFTPDKLEGITPSGLQEMMAFSFSEEPAGGYVGAVVEGFEWTYAFTVPEDQDLKEGDSITVRFPETSDETVQATVRSVSAAENGKKAVVISSIRKLEMLSSARCQPIEVVTKTYSGYRVSKDAIRYVDNVVGVYVLKGKIVAFAEVDIVYSADEYVIIKAAEGSSLVANDDVVVAGRDLYDGKIVKPS